MTDGREDEQQAAETYTYAVTAHNEDSESDDGVPDIDEIDWGPPTRPLEEGEPCPACGHPFDDDEWRIRKLPSGPTIGETWKGECPNCEQETYNVGT